MGSFWDWENDLAVKRVAHSSASLLAIAAFPGAMAEVSYYEADLTDALDQLNDAMGKLGKAPPAIKTEASTGYCESLWYSHAQALCCWCL